ncbi:hypothetical protein MICRO11B_440004 [Micrococcus luteus]|nr:hypothetical protein MICRO11B_440004 [Micrococcus luteus]
MWTWYRRMAEEGTWDRVLQMLIAAADAGGARVIQTIVRHALVAVLTLLATIVLSWVGLGS